MKKPLSKISKKTQKIILIVFGGILLILIITNPSNNRFREYLNSKGYMTENEVLQDHRTSYTYTIKHNYRRESNYFIFSTFKYEGEKYFGILGNFYEVE